MDPDRERRLRRRSVPVVLLFLVVASLVSCTACEEAPHSTDAELIARFRAHRAEFERLRDLLLDEPAVYLIGPGEVRAWEGDPPAEALAPQPRHPLGEYRALLRKLGVSRATRDITATPPRIWFDVSSQGYVAHGSSKSYLYATELENWPLLPSLDEMTAARKGEGIRRIEGDWYLHFYGD